MLNNCPKCGKQPSYGTWASDGPDFRYGEEEYDCCGLAARARDRVKAQELWNQYTADRESESL